MNKILWVNSMAHSLTGRNAKRFRNLVGDLSAKELVALRRNQDLVERVKDIAKMSKEQLTEEINDGFGMEITSCMNGDVWIGTDNLDDFRPDWATATGNKLPFGGWYLSYETEDNDFEEWSRRFLMQDVRTEIWERYLSKKVEEAAEKAKKESGASYVPQQQDVQDIQDIWLGMYL